MTTAVNYALYQIGWLACVLGAARGHATGGALIGALLVVVHLALARRPAIELRLVLLGAGAGMAADSLQVAAGLLEFDTAPAGWPDWLAPPWIAVMWAQFATTLRYCLARFQRPGAGWLAVIGALGGPAAYASGRSLGAVEFGTPAASTLAALAVVWALLLPLVVGAARRTQPSIGTYRWDSPSVDGNHGTNAFVRRT